MRFLRDIEDWLDGNYLRVTLPDIAYPVSIMSQFMTSAIVEHWDAVHQILCYLKAAFWMLMHLYA